MAENQARRIEALAGAVYHNARVRVAPAAPASRLSLRARGDAVAALSKALGVSLPTKPKTSATAKDRSALWLGPDEWLLIAADGTDLGEAAASAGVMCSAVNVSHRNVGIVVSGPGAQATINAACPQDLSLKTFPVGACSRTIFGKIEIVLFRTEEDTFRVECWRSFSDYCYGMLTEGARDAAA